MCPCVWKLPAMGHDIVLAALTGRGVRVEPAEARPGHTGQWFNARRGRATQPFVVREGGELEAFYRLSWPWRWPSEAGLFDDVCRTFDGCCERVL